MNTPAPSAVKAYLWMLLPTPRPNDQLFLCYDDTAPPWDEENLFYLKDESGKTWFCHPSKMEATKENLLKVAEKVSVDYTPQNPTVREKRIHCPIKIHVAAVRAVSLEELSKLLGSLAKKNTVKPTV